MIAEALVVAARKRRIDDSGGAVDLHLLAQHLLEHLGVQLVEIIVEIANLVDHLGVLIAKQRYKQTGHLHVDHPHLREGLAQALGNRALWVAVARQLRNVLREVCHALERGAHAQRTHHEAQVARDRLLAGENVDGLLVELARKLVYLLTVVEHLLGRLAPKAREVFVLSQLQGLGYAQIAAQVGVSERTVKRYMAQGFELCLTLME